MWLSSLSLQAPCVAKAVWYQHLVPCLIPTGFLEPAPRAGSPPYTRGLVPPPLAAHCCHGSSHWDCASPQHSFQESDPGLAAGRLLQPRGMPAFQAKGTREVLAKEAAVPFQFPWQC